MEKVYNKLVRDKIPQIIEASGNRCKIRLLSPEEYQQMVDKKLSEELAEYLESKEPEELADLIEVIAAAAQARGCSWDKLMQLREEKRQKRGGFEKGILLESVTEI